MAKNELELLKEAFVEAFSSKYDEELAASTENADCSLKHYKKMSKILGFNVVPETKVRRISFKKILIAALVAALIFLTGCVAIFYDEIRELVTSFGDGYVEVTFPDDENPDESNDDPIVVPTTIEEAYTLNYVPEGYTLVANNATTVMVNKVWRNDSGSTIIFRQSLLDTFSVYVDTESGYSEKIIIGEYDVYYQSGERNNYIWNNGRYCFTLNFSEKISETEIAKIIESTLLENN